MAAESRYHNRTTWRTLAVIELLARSDRPVSLAALSRDLDCSKSSLFPILKTMEDAGYLVSDGGGVEYALAPKIYGLVRQQMLQQNPVRAFDALSRRIVDDVQETMQMAVLDGSDVVYVAKQECNHPIRLVSDVGQRLPTYATALGKCLLAEMDESEVRSRLDGVEMRPLTGRTIGTIEELLAALGKVRTQGAAEDWQEVSEGLCCVAAPVRGGDGKIVAAISFSVPIHRATPDHWATLRAVIKSAASEVSQHLGHVAVAEPLPLEVS